MGWVAGCAIYRCGRFYYFAYWRAWGMGRRATWRPSRGIFLYGYLIHYGRTGFFDRRGYMGILRFVIRFSVMSRVLTRCGRFEFGRSGWEARRTAWIRHGYIGGDSGHCARIPWARARIPLAGAGLILCGLITYPAPGWSSHRWRHGMLSRACAMP